MASKTKNTSLCFIPDLIILGTWVREMKEREVRIAFKNDGRSKV